MSASDPTAQPTGAVALGDAGGQAGGGGAVALGDVGGGGDGATPKPEPYTPQVGPAVQEITQRAQLLVREEIELARAELTEKVSRLVKGAVVGAVAGVVALLGLIFLLHALSWLAWLGLAGGTRGYWLGFLVIAVLLFILAAVAGALAARFVKAGTPPKPEMAMDEAQRIKQTVDEARRG